MNTWETGKGACGFFEPLEDRRMMSVSVPTSHLASQVASPAIVLPVSILGPSRVQGTYKGSGSFTAPDNSPRTVSMTLRISASSLTIKSDLLGTFSRPLSARQFTKIRRGAIHLTLSSNGNTLAVNATVSGDARTITGTFAYVGEGAANGPFTVTKR